MTEIRTVICFISSFVILVLVIRETSDLIENMSLLGSSLTSTIVTASLLGMISGISDK